MIEPPRIFWLQVLATGMLNKMICLFLICCTINAYNFRVHQKVKPLGLRYSEITDDDEIYQIAPRPTNETDRKSPWNKYKDLPKYERDIKRRKLFALSTLLEDLLPDPTQGQSKLLNRILDAGKIVKRSFFLVLNFIFELPPSVSVYLVILIFLYSFTLPFEVEK